MGITVGSSLTLDTSQEAINLSLALSAYIIRMNTIERDTGGTPAADYECNPRQRVFKQAGVPSTNATAESPGQDMCLILDTTNNDLYLIYDWAAANSFTALLIREGD